MKRMLLVLFLISFIALPRFAYSMNWVRGAIDQVLAHDDGTENFGGQIHVIMKSDMVYPPSCVNQEYYMKYFVIDLSRNPANAQYSMILGAKLANRTITVYLNDSCIDGVAKARNIVLESDM